MKSGVRPNGGKTALRRATEPVGLPYHLLEERSEVLRRLWEMSSEGIFVLRNGRVKECNHFLATRAGYAMDEIEGTCFASFFDCKSIPAVEAVCGQTTRGHEMMSLPRALLVCKNGSSIEVQLKACACLFGGKPAVLVTLRATDSQPSDDSWDADLDDFFVSEESPSILQRVI